MKCDIASDDHLPRWNKYILIILKPCKQILKYFVNVSDNV